MSHCQSCNRRLTLFEGQLPPGPGDEVQCPYCGQQQTVPEVGQRLTPIARINNLADVGYLEDCLHQAGTEHQVTQRDEFSAVTGGWQMAFVLQVREDQAEAAAEVLRRATQGENASMPQHDEPETTVAASPRHLGWLPVALVVAACGLIYMSLRGPGGIVQRGGGGGAANQRDDLTEALGEQHFPLSSHPGPRMPQRRLYFDPTTERVVLDEDTDGDGRFDRRRTFHNGRQVSD